MDEKENRFYKYVDDKSILVITPNNKLIRIHCPFAVRDADGKIFQVDAVSEITNMIYYRVNGECIIWRNLIIQC